MSRGFGCGLHPLKPYRLYPRPCVINLPFVYNRRFTVKKGEEWFKDGELSFTEIGKRDGTYRSIFGPIFSVSSVIYENSNENLSKAFRRLTAARGSYEEDQKLFSNQRSFLSKFKHNLMPVFLCLSRYEHKYRQGEYGDMYKYAELPHDKKKLRMLQTLSWESDSLQRNRLGLKTVWCKMKCDELNKYGKYPRCIGDLGVDASMRGMILMSNLKDALSSEIVYINGFATLFVKSPTQDKLTLAFNLLLDPPPGARGSFVYFSDDSCISFRNPNGSVTYYNMDIKTCDTSHGPEIFDMLNHLCPALVKDEMEVLVNQCRADTRLVPPGVRKPKQCVILSHEYPILYSGSVITTFINNIANLLILLAISLFYDGSKSSVLTAANNAGYNVTLADCPTMYGLQFLKHSPVIDDQGEIRPLINLGVILRAIGTCRGDLPGRGDLNLRARRFNANLLLSTYPKVSVPFIEKFKKKFGPGVLIHDPHAKVLVSDSDVVFSVSDVEYFKRYTSDLDLIDELLIHLEASEIKTSVRTTLSDLVLLKDYDVEHDTALEYRDYSG